MITITDWFARNGNNILQVIHAIYYAKMKHQNLVQFPKHHLLKTTEIKIPKEEFFSEMETLGKIENVKGIFFYPKEFGFDIQHPFERKQIFQKYIKPIFKIPLNNRCTVEEVSTLFIHIRSGDLFSSTQPHSGYVQPPLKYYTDVIYQYGRVVAVCEDDANPCVKKIREFSHVHYECNDLIRDLEIFSTAKHFMMGLGIFGFLIYFMNDNLKTLYIPRYTVEKQLGLDPDSDINWGPDITVHIIDLPNYIQCGQWYNTAEQRRFMITYPKSS